MWNMLAVQDIRKTFALKNGQRFTALDSVSCRVRSGGITAVVGPDGAGKTTLLRIVAGLLSQDSGTLLFDGKNSDSQNAHIGYVPVL